MMAGLASCSEPSPPPGLEGSGGAASSSTADSTPPSSASETGAGSGPGSGGQSSGGSAGSSPGTAAVDSSGGTETETMGDPGGEPGVVRFAAFGDQGEGNGAQQLVANAAEAVCADRGCDFALLLGDNFYDTGVTSVDDVQFLDKFETIYEGLDIPFYVVAGNHDYGTLANDWARGNHQVAYTQFSDRWTMPHFWYTFSSDSGGTQFFAFDTARMMWNHDVGDQRTWMAAELAASTADWKIAFAHHPYVSNGEHGNAGSYQGFPQLPFISGVQVEEFLADFVCGQAQVYISGHDHNRQAFDPVCGTTFLVSGASAKTDEFVFRDDNPTQWGDDTREGFLWVEIEGTELIAAFYDLDGNLDHEMTVSL
jgi:tartrate-resistant acid phosphatase type 5